MPYSYLMIVSFIGAVLIQWLIFISDQAHQAINTDEINDRWGHLCCALHSLSFSSVAIYYDLSQDLAFWYAGGVARCLQWGTLEILVPIILINHVFCDNFRGGLFTHINGG